jgi:hypothetical protein
MPSAVLAFQNRIKRKCSKSERQSMQGRIGYCTTSSIRPYGVKVLKRMADCLRLELCGGKPQLLAKFGVEPTSRPKPGRRQTENVSKD